MFLAYLLAQLLDVKRSPKCHQKSMRKLSSRKVASEEARSAEFLASWVAGGRVREEVNLPPGLGGLEERK